MGVLRSRRKVRFTSKKYFLPRHKVVEKQRRNIRTVTAKHSTSTPIDRRKRNIHCRKLTPFRSPYAKRPKLSPIDRVYKISPIMKVRWSLFYLYKSYKALIQKSCFVIPRRIDSTFSLQWSICTKVLFVAIILKTLFDIDPIKASVLAGCQRRDLKMPRLISV